MFVEGTPFDDSIHTKKLLERIGPIRETHYGGFYDFVPDMAKADTAYTNIALAAHTDTTYFTDPAGLQAFHLLSHTPAPGEPDAAGGESLLVDGFHAASVLKEENAKFFRELARKGLPWHASGNEGVTITPDALLPVFEIGANDTLLKVRWNADDRGGKLTLTRQEEIAGSAAGNDGPEMDTPALILSARVRFRAHTHHGSSVSDTDMFSRPSGAVRQELRAFYFEGHEVVCSCRQVGADTQKQGVGILVPAEARNDGHFRQSQSPTRQERLYRAEKNLRWL